MAFDDKKSHMWEGSRAKSRAEEGGKSFASVVCVAKRLREVLTVGGLSRLEDRALAAGTDVGDSLEPWKRSLLSRKRRRLSCSNLAISRILKEKLDSAKCCEAELFCG